MFTNKKLISNQILPEINFKDTLYLWAQIPWIRSQKQLNFSEFFGTDGYILTNTARSALGVLISELKLSKNKKIGIPAFCCCVMATPFLQAGYQIEWIDTDKNGIIDPHDFESKASNVSLLLAPHIFGQAAPMLELHRIAQAHDIFVVEDCAHRLPDAGWNADARLYSFGREKIVSCVSGGALVINPTSKLSSSQVPKFSSSLPSASLSWTLRYMLHPMIYNLSLPWWFWGGKLLPWIFQKLKGLPLAVTPLEKNGAEDVPLERLSYPHQKLLRRKIGIMNKKIDHREAMSKLWENVLTSSLSIPQKDIIIPDNHFRTIIRINPSFKLMFLKKAKQFGMHLREWDGNPISPDGTNLEAFGYQKGQCPNAEKFAQNYLTLPTNSRVSGKDIVGFGKIF
ncbi:MAG TPA: DegT/DnrJ/EryC1/StrS family aminotransferase [Candidatus Gracilibacteria bacterium]